MAALLSTTGELQLTLKLLRITFDPFQHDLEWFDYEAAVEGSWQGGATEAAEQSQVRTAVRGKFNRQELNELVGHLKALLESSQPMRFEPADLKFYFEWSHETPSVYLLITWFDLALSPRTLEQRFPTAHSGYRFLADKQSLQRFREQVQAEFSGRPQSVM